MIGRSIYGVVVMMGCYSSIYGVVVMMGCCTPDSIQY